MLCLACQRLQRSDSEWCMHTSGFCHHYLAFVAVQSCMIGFHQPTSTHMIIYNDWLEWLFFYLCSRVVLYVKHCRLQVHLFVNRYVEICAALGHGLGSERRSCATSTKGNMIHTSYMCNIHIDIYMHICLYKYANTHTHTHAKICIYTLTDILASNCPNTKDFRRVQRIEFDFDVKRLRFRQWTCPSES